MGHTIEELVKTEGHNKEEWSENCSDKNGATVLNPDWMIWSLAQNFLSRQLVGKGALLFEQGPIHI